ncbi:MAG: rhodanese-like domain-containing protein [Rhodobacterales bacterium]|nr:rhodanese-like domain-containing protein [Rhodobacterales bacterium]MDX5389512.1 rhodanese-like domain-containing protein [Rhodobacterales bacterium]MDX5489209.1 rhodanese-like domain-containing protein [Rhodobacterales bacterium]
MTYLLKALALVAALGLPFAAQSEETLAEAITGYMDFATYDSGIIVPEQLDRTVFEAALFVDTRDADQFAAGHIPGAVHIEWREVPGRLDELPDTGMVILYCNTGSLSAQAAFAARLLGRENVLVLQTGFDGWQANAAYKPE